MISFIAGWLCGWGAIVLVGLGAGLVLRINRPHKSKPFHVLDVSTFYQPADSDGEWLEWHRESNNDAWRELLGNYIEGPEGKP